ncbi:L-rhamnono-gamma-lactonase [Vermiconidia calcicola]|uniref:L-rhamnono-gamma-lactonase n=1 Tax=Vermiconidia calcicola TaxID=1690605 RepID=A0ACC3NUG8_9PEZI|nr:L-rhamnono-gamma-lactonase [Vermiconidia calcicola]
MPKRVVVDSHIHLWPEETANETGHAWMTPGMPLAMPHLLSDYYRASGQGYYSGDVDTRVSGVVYIETDVRYDTHSDDVATFVKGPLDEIAFLRRVVEGAYDERDSDMLLGIVPWAPMDRPPSVLKEYLRLAELRAGERAWARVKGFRFLLQSIHDQESFAQLVLSNDFISNLKELGKRRFSFDVGVDQRSGGIWQLELVARATQLAHQDVAEDEKVVFVINHLCKPNLTGERTEFEAWCKAVSDMAGCGETFMKLSGAFSELPPGLREIDDIVIHLRPWVAQVLKCFRPRRIMFGSDWPVCNVNGPRKQDSWAAWKDVVKLLFDDEELGLSEVDKDWIWQGTARDAYRL